MKGFEQPLVLKQRQQGISEITYYRVGRYCWKPHKGETFRLQQNISDCVFLDMTQDLASPHKGLLVVFLGRVHVLHSPQVDLEDRPRGPQPPPPPFFDCIPKMFLRFCFENHFIKCSFILSSETLTLLDFASRKRPQCCMLHVLKRSFYLGWGSGGTRPPLSKFFGSAPVLPWPFCPWVLMGTGDVLEKRDRMPGLYFEIA